MSKFVETNEKIAEKVVEGYKKIENGAVEGFQKVTDKFVGKFFTKEGETVEEAKARMKKEQEKLEEDAKKRAGLK